MMNMKTLIILATIMLFSGGAFAQIKSVYTDLSDTKCKTVELQEDEGGSYKGVCNGVAGFKLNLLEGDLRQSIDVVSPDGKEHQLRLWEHFGGFSAVGEKAEWRVKGKTPVALIFRFNVATDPDDVLKRKSYLIVAKITKDFACVINIVEPGKNQNEQARKFADAAAVTPCRVSE